jgi:hypothetical protein
MTVLLIFLLVFWFCGAVFFTVTGWNHEVAKGHRLALIKAALLWPFRLDIEIW